MNKKRREKLRENKELWLAALHWLNHPDVQANVEQVDYWQGVKAKCEQFAQENGQELKNDK